MEIVLAVLLLFGGFMLGSVSVDKSGNNKQSTMIAPHVDGAASMVSDTQTMYKIDQTRCHGKRAVIYRDLTVPYPAQINESARENSECDGHDE